MQLAAAESRARLLHPDRLFPIEPRARTIARRIYKSVKDLPIISPHGHTDPCWYAENKPFPDPATLLVKPDLAPVAPQVHRITPESAGWRYVGFEVYDLAPGRTLERTTETWLCRCGGSQNKPYCDGSHRKIGFTAPV